MLRLANLFRLLNELVFVLLGLLLVQLALSGRFLWQRPSWAWIGLSVFLIYWGFRAWWRRGRSATRRQVAAAVVRASSLALVGAVMLGVVWLPFSYVPSLLATAGGILALRGLVSAVLVARSP